MTELNTEIVDLASAGFFYPAESLLAVGTVEMRPMTAADEDVLCSGNLVKRGLALPRLLTHILPKGLDIDSILQCDLETILLNARIMNYGASGTMRAVCAECGESFESDISFSFRPTDFSFNGLQRGCNVLPYTLPTSGQTVLFRLPTWREHQSWKPLGWVEFIKRLTLSVEGEEDVERFYDVVMRGIDSKSFRDFYEKRLPGFVTGWKVKCSKCEYINQVKVDVTTDIFNIRTESRSVIHDEIFSLCYHSNGAFTQDVVYNMPISLRNFYIKKLIDLKNEENDQTKKREAEIKASSKNVHKPNVSKPSIPSGKR